MMGEYGLHVGMSLIWWLPLLLLIAVAFNFYSSNKQKSHRSAKDILDERYAKGEIDTNEYEDRLKNLQSHKKGADD